MGEIDSLEDIENAIDLALLSQRRLKKAEKSSDGERKSTQYSFNYILTECIEGILW